jgi:hypothetical protein
MNDERVVDDLLSGKFSVDLISADLRSSSDFESYSYSGPGRIWQDSEGHLRLKLYHRFESTIDMTKEMNATQRLRELPLGRIVGDEHYYEFRGVEPFGATWTAERIWVRAGFEFPAAGRVVEVKLDGIESRLEQPKGYSDLPRTCLWVLPGTYSVPSKSIDWDHLGETVRVDDFCIKGWCRCVLRCHKDRLLVRLFEFAEGVRADAEELILEALGVCLGARLHPTYEARTEGAARTWRLRSRRKNFERDRLLPPVPLTWPDEHGNIALLTQVLIETRKGQRSAPLVSE